MADDLVSIRIRLSGGKEAAGELRMVKGEMSSIAPTTARAATSTNRSLSRMRSGWNALKKVAKVGALGIGAGIGLLATQIKPAISATQELATTTGSLNQNFGLSVRSASRWAAVGISRGLDSAKMATAFKTLATQVTSARDGSTAAQKAFKKLDLDFGDLSKGAKDMNWLLMQTANGFASLPPGADKAAIAGKLFGRGWQDIVPILRDGAGSLQEQLDLANKYGATFGGKSLKSVQDLAGAQRELKLAQLGLQIAFTTKVAPMLMDAVLWVAKFVNQMRTGKGAGGQFANQMRTVGGILKVVWKIIKWVAGAVRWFGEKCRDTAKRTRIAFNGIGFGATVLADKVAGAFQWCVRAAQNFVGFIKSLPGKMAAAGKGAFNWLKNAFRNAINFIIDGWNSLHFHIPEIDPPGPGPKFGGMDIGVPPIPRLAAGGVAVGGGWSIVGERGPEMRYMPRGAQVEPIRGARRLAAGRARGGGTRQPIVLELDGRVLAETTVTLQEDAEARA